MVTLFEVLAGILCTLLFVFVNLDTIGNFLNSLFGEELTTTTSKIDEDFKELDRLLEEYRNDIK